MKNVRGLISTSEENSYFDPDQIEIVKKVGSKSEKMNSRTVNNPGWMPEKMDALRKGIQRDGLNHPLEIGILDSCPKLIAGERRLKCIQRLIKDDEKALRSKEDRVLVWDSRLKKMLPAIDVYRKRGVQCKVSEVKDETDLIRRNIQENNLHEPLTDFEVLYRCQEMENAGISRAEQAEIFDVSEAWISQTHSLLDPTKVHPCVVEYMEKGLLLRTSAVTFISVAYDQQEKTLMRAVQLSHGQAEEKIQVVEAELSAQQAELKYDEHIVSLSKYMGTTAETKSSRRNIDRNKQKITKNLLKIDQLNASIDDKKVSVEHVNMAAKELGAGDDIHRPQSNKKARKVLMKIQEALGAEDDGLVEIDGKNYDASQVRLASGILNWYLDQNYKNSFFDLFDEI